MVTKKRRKGLKINILQKGGFKGYHDLYSQAIEFFAKNLMSTRLVNTLTIRVELRSQNKNLRRGTIGFVQEHKNLKDFRIVAKRDMQPLDLISTLAHEMVHVEQFARKRLKYKKKKLHPKYHSTKNVPCWEGEIHENTEYYKQPWEIEARIKQLDLVEMFTEYWYGIAGNDAVILPPINSIAYKTSIFAP